MHCGRDWHPMDDDIQHNRFWAALGYLWILCIFPLYFKKTSPFAEYHAKQGFVLFVLSLFLWILGWLPFVGWIFWVIGPLSYGAASLVGIAHALFGKRWQLPLLGSFAQKLAF